MHKSQAPKSVSKVDLSQTTPRELWKKYISKRQPVSLATHSTSSPFE